MHKPHSYSSAVSCQLSAPALFCPSFVKHSTVHTPNIAVLVLSWWQPEQQAWITITRSCCAGLCPAGRLYEKTLGNKLNCGTSGYLNACNWVTANSFESNNALALIRYYGQNLHPVSAGVQGM